MYSEKQTGLHLTLCPQSYSKHSQSVSGLGVDLSCNYMELLLLLTSFTFSASLSPSVSAAYSLPPFLSLSSSLSCICRKNVICAIEVHTPASIYLCSVKKPSGHGGTREWVCSGRRRG